MALQFYNTASRKKEVFTLPEGVPAVRMYCCGPTVYHFAHIGNLRTYIFEDFLVRTLKYYGYKVNHIVNITDVGHLTSDADSGDDKMEKGAAREGKSVWDIAKFYTDAFMADWHRLNIQEPTRWTPATQHIQEQIMTDSSLMYRYFIDEYGSGEISFYKSKPKSTGMTEEQKTERQKSLIRGKHLRYVKSFWEQAYELRKDFVKNYSIANGQSSATLGKILLKYALTQHNAYDGCIPKSHDWNDTYLREVFSLPADPEEDPEYEKDPEHPYHKEWISVWDQIDRKIPIARAMVAWAVAGGVFWPDAPTHGSYNSTDGSYQQNSYENSGVRELYDFLVEIGYQLSDMEKQLLDGTHECYKME